MRNAITHLRLLPRKAATLLISWYQATLSPDHPPSRLRRFGGARDAAVKAIEIYQATFSPDHGPLRHLYLYGYCRHAPTCSEYGKIVIGERGLLIGSLMLLRRLIACNPWTKPSDTKILETMLRATSQ